MRKEGASKSKTIFLPRSRAYKCKYCARVPKLFWQGPRTVFCLNSRPLKQTRRNQNTSEKRSLSPGSYCTVKGGMLKKSSKSWRDPRGMESNPGPPHSGSVQRFFPDTHTNSQNSSLPPSRAPVASTVRRRYRRHRSEERERRLSVPAPSPGKTTTRSRCARGSREPALPQRGAPGAAEKQSPPAASVGSSETEMQNEKERRETGEQEKATKTLPGRQEDRLKMPPEVECLP